MDKKKRLALVAHDNRKADLIQWVKDNWKQLVKHSITCTGTTGKLVEEALLNELPDDVKHMLHIEKLKSGPLGGDQQLGARIAEGTIDVMIFLWDPMQAQPHDVDVKALLRIASVYNVPIAINRATADFMISSRYIDNEYTPVLRDYSGYIMRNVNI
jgi:methylglyoxal synthase